MLIHDVALHLFTMSDFSPQVVSSVFRGPSNRSHVDRALADIKIFMLYGLAWLQLKKKDKGGSKPRHFYVCFSLHGITMVHMKRSKKKNQNAPTQASQDKIQSRRGISKTAFGLTLRVSYFPDHSPWLCTDSKRSLVNVVFNPT